jgi:hypothetical protein
MSNFRKELNWLARIHHQFSDNPSDLAGVKVDESAPIRLPAKEKAL